MRKVSYNDVVVRHPGGEIDIFGYPEDIFPPTDFHSATLHGDRILLLGSLGYAKERRWGQVQVITIDCQTFTATPIETFGTVPGWIHEHDAQVQDDGRSILLTGGKVDRSEDDGFIENIDDWRLDLSTWRWERLTDRRWERFEIRRRDENNNHLWDVRCLLEESTIDWANFLPAEVLQQRESRTAERKSQFALPLRFDLVPVLYSPPIPHEVLPEREKEFGVYRIRIDDTIVRYVEEPARVYVTVEGEIAPDIVERLQQDLIEKFEHLEQAPAMCRTISPA